jgi:hypothetical protein
VQHFCDKIADEKSKMATRSKRTLTKAEKREKRIAAESKKKSAMLTEQEVTEVPESNTEPEGTGTALEAGDKTTQISKTSSASTSHNKNTSPGSKSSSEAGAGSKTKQSSKTPSTSSKKKKRKETTSGRSNKRHKVYDPRSSAAKAKRGSGPTPSDDDHSYSAENEISSNSETEDDHVLGDQRKKKADKRKKPPKQAEQNSVVEDSTVESTPGPTAQARQQADDLRAALIASEAGRSRAEQQVRNISKVKLADDFLIGQVRTWSKEVLWKQCKFITNHKTMSKVMRKAAKKFKVPEEETDHWMATYAHTVRDGLNQKRNAVAQDLRLTVISKYDTLQCCC